MDNLDPRDAATTKRRPRARMQTRSRLDGPRSTAGLGAHPDAIHAWLDGENVNEAAAACG